MSPRYTPFDIDSARQVTRFSGRVGTGKAFLPYTLQDGQGKKLLEKFDTLASFYKGVMVDALVAKDWVTKAKVFIKALQRDELITPGVGWALLERGFPNKYHKQLMHHVSTEYLTLDCTSKKNEQALETIMDMIFPQRFLSEGEVDLYLKEKGIRRVERLMDVDLLT